MHFDTFSDFLAMGGYAFYVWTAYGITFFALIYLVISSRRKHKKILIEIEQRQARQTRIDAAKDMENTL
jgi:heme exporter protein D